VEGSEVRVLLGAPRGLICCRGLPRGVVARGVVAGVGECEGGGNMEEPFFFERKRRNMLDATTLSARMSVVAWLVASIWGGVGGWERESPTQDASVSRKVYRQGFPGGIISKLLRTVVLRVNMVKISIQYLISMIIR
jgi:hypothetical protein